MLESKGQSTINEHDLKRSGSIGQDSRGVCICPICGFRIPHELGIPCYNKSCPRCGMIMNSGI